MKSGPLFLALLVITSCAATQTSHILIGTARPRIKPDEVKIYFRQPDPAYEEIALIHTDSQWDWKFTDHGHSDAVIKRLQMEAAKLGANGILLGNFGDKTIATGGTYHSGASFNAPLGVKVAQGMAIYIDPKSQPHPPASSSTQPDAKRL